MATFPDRTHNKSFTMVSIVCLFLFYAFNPGIPLSMITIPTVDICESTFNLFCNDNVPDVEHSGPLLLAVDIGTVTEYHNNSIKLSYELSLYILNRVSWTNHLYIVHREDWDIMNTDYVDGQYEEADSRDTVGVPNMMWLGITAATFGNPIFHDGFNGAGAFSLYASMLVAMQGKSLAKRD